MRKRILKKYSALLLCIALAMTMFPVTALAEETVYSFSDVGSYDGEGVPSITFTYQDLTLTVYDDLNNPFCDPYDNYLHFYSNDYGTNAGVSVTVEKTDGSSFTPTDVDAAAYFSDGAGKLFSFIVTGYFSGGATVEDAHNNITSTGVYTAVTVDFTGFTNIVRLEFRVENVSGGSEFVEGAIKNLALTVGGSSDTTAPTLSSTSASDVTSSGATLNFTSDEAGTYYYLVYAAAAAAPDAATVKAQGAAVAKGSGTATASANTASVTGLAASTAYKAYVIVEDAAGNASAVSTIDINTSAPPDTTAPTLSSTSASDVTSSGATLNFTSDEAGTYYYLVYAAAAAAPDAATVKAQGTAVAKGSGAAAASANTAGVTGLSSSTDYKAYVIVEDAADNASAVSTIEITTSAIGELTGSITQSSYSNVNLTSLGDVDWAVWGYASSGTSTSLSPDESKSGGSGISDLMDIDPGIDDALRGLGQYHINHTFNWSNGTSTTSATGAYAGLQHNVSATYQTGDGFSFTVPADTTKRRLIVYTAVHYAVGELTATLSDGSAATLTLEHDAKTGVNSPSRFVIDYAAGSDGKTLTVTFVSTWNSNDGNGNVQIYAVALSDYHTATINIFKDGAAVDASGSVDLRQGGSVVATAASGATGVYTALVLNGTYDIYIDGTDTGKDITISAADNSTTINYYTVSFAVSDAGKASGSTISATAGGSDITSGVAVLSGKQVIITVTGNGADSYTYAWTGDGTGGETTQALTISSLSSEVDATCTVTGFDTTAPTLSSTSASDVTYYGATLNFTSDEAGTYYYLVYAAADTAPNAATVKAQGTAVAKGSGVAAASANTAGVTGLSGSTAYKAYVIVEDAAGNASAVSTIDINTSAPPDTTAPTLSSTSASDVTLSGATLNFTSDEAGTYYYLVYAAADTASNAATVKAQGTAVAKGSGAAAASANTAVVTGLSASTGYKAYVIVEDAAGNASAVSTIDINTSAPPDTTAPTLSSTSASDVTLSGATLNFTSDEAGTYYYLVYAAAAAAPDAATVKAQGTAVAKGSGAAAASANTASVTGLSGSTAYKAYVIVEDAAGNASAVSAIEITTLTASVSATPASALTEENLDTNSLTVTLTNETFADSTLSASNFVLNNAPTGLDVESVSYTNATHCTVSLAFDGTDFDADVTDFSLTIKAAELAADGDLTTGTLTITATVEPLP